MERGSHGPERDMAPIGYEEFKEILSFGRLKGFENKKFKFKKKKNFFSTKFLTILYKNFVFFNQIFEI